MLIIFCCISFYSFHKENITTKEISISKIEIYYLPLDLKTRTRVSQETIKTMSATKKITIDSIPNLSKELENLKIKSGWEAIDLRILCEIYQSNNQIDQLGFNRNKMVYYNGKIYKKNKKLFNKVYSVTYK